MVFSSIIFLFAFLPIVLLCYHLLLLPVWLGSTAKVWLHLGNLFLLSSSLLFYFWGEKFLIWVFIATVLIDFGAALLISGAFADAGYGQLVPGGPRRRFQKIVLAFSICSNMAMLGYFKYFNFGVKTYNSIVAQTGFSSAAWTPPPPSCCRSASASLCSTR